MVLPSQADGNVGMTPFGAEHSTMFTPLELLGAAKSELAGTATLIVCPLENGVFAVNGLWGWAALEMMVPSAGPTAPAVTTRPRAASAPTTSPTPVSCRTSHDLLWRVHHRPGGVMLVLLHTRCTRSLLSRSCRFCARSQASPK